MGTQVLEEQQSYKYLGTTLDPYLKMNLHAQKTAHTATYRISLFRKFRHLLTHEAAHLVYTATILPQIEFASLFYNAVNQKSLKDIQTIQNSALKCILHLPPLTHTQLLHDTAKLNTLHHRYRTLLAGYAYEKTRNAENLVKVARPTRIHKAVLLNVPKTKKEISRKSLKYRAAMLWNSLPIATRNSHNKNTFL